MREKDKKVSIFQPKDPKRKYSNQKTPKEKNVIIDIIDKRMRHLPLSETPSRPNGKCHGKQDPQ